MNGSKTLLTLIIIVVCNVQNCEAKKWLDSFGMVNFEAGIGVSNQFVYSNQLFVHRASLHNRFLDANFIVRTKKMNNNSICANINIGNSSFINDSLEFGFQHLSFGIRLTYNLKPLLNTSNFEVGLGLSITNSKASVTKNSQVMLVQNGANPLNVFMTNMLVSSATYFTPIEVSYILRPHSPKYFKFSFFYNLAFKENEIKGLTKIDCSTFGIVFRLPIATVI